MRDAEFRCICDSQHTAHSRIDLRCRSSLNLGPVANGGFFSCGMQPPRRFAAAALARTAYGSIGRFPTKTPRGAFRASAGRAMVTAVDAKGIRDDFGFDRCVDYCCHWRHLFLGDRQICQRPSASPASQAARGANLPRRHSAEGAATGGHLLAQRGNRFPLSPRFGRAVIAGGSNRPAPRRAPAVRAHPREPEDLRSLTRVAVRIGAIPQRSVGDERCSLGRAKALRAEMGRPLQCDAFAEANRTVTRQPS